MLGTLFRIAFRNVTRNTKRSLITMAALIVGCAAIVFARGFINGLHQSMINGITQTMTGDVQIHHKDYLKTLDALPLHLSVKLDQELEQHLKADARIDAWAGRIRFTGMVTNGISTSLFIGNALDPEKEPRVTPDLQQDVAEGKPISVAQTDGVDGVVIADRLARAMKLKVGDTITLNASTKEGAINTIDVVVQGIRKSTAALSGTEGKMIDMSLKAAQDLLYMPDEVTEVVLNVTHQDDSEAVANDLNRILSEKSPQLNLSANDWREVSAFFVDILDMQDTVLWVIIVVLFGLTITIIVNTMLMAVLERVREIGTMLAMGVRRKRIIGLFLCEGAAIGILGSSAGVLLGYLVVMGFQWKGVAVKPAVYNRPVFVRPYVEPEYLLMVVCIAIVAALLAAIYPARRAAQLDPAEALRTV